MAQMRIFTRPAYMLGPRTPHPLDIAIERATGNWDKSVFVGEKGVYTGLLREHEGVHRTLAGFSQLSQAASVNPALDRAISTALRQTLTDEQGVTQYLSDADAIYRVRVGLRTVKIDLREWVPKLREFYDTAIRQAGDALVEDLDNRGAGLKESVLYARQELNTRELLAYQADGGTAARWEDIPEDVLGDIRKRLRKEDTGNPMVARAPIFLYNQWVAAGAPAYASLESMTTQMSKQRERLVTEAADIRSGSLRRQGYTTAVYKLTRPVITRWMSDAHGAFSRAVSRQFRTYYLKERTREDEPYNSWAESFPLYVSAIMHQIHAERAIRYAKRKANIHTSEDIGQEPAAGQLTSMQRDYMREWIASIRGEQTPIDRVANRAANYDLMRQPHIMGRLIERVTGKDTREIAKQWRDTGRLDPRIVERIRRTMGQITYGALLGPFNVAALSMTEFSFLARDLAIRPTEIPKGLWWIGRGAAIAAAGGSREALSFALSKLAGTQRWFSEPSYKGVLSIVHELQEKAGLFGEARHREGSRLAEVGMDIAHGLRAAWFGSARGAEYLVRVTNYEYQKSRLLDAMPDLDYDTLTNEAARFANTQVGAFGPREVSPFTRGHPMMELYMPFKRFMGAKAEQFREDWKGMVPGGEIDRAGLGMAPPPPKQPPPRVPNAGSGNDWTPEEEAARQRWNEEAPPYGEGFPVSSQAAAHYRRRLLLGLPASFYILHVLGNFWLGDEDDTLWDRMNPVNFAYLDRISSLWFMDELHTILTLGVTNALVGGLNAESTEKLNAALQKVLYDIPFAGRIFRYADEEQKRRLHQAMLMNPRMGGMMQTLTYGERFAGMFPGGVDPAEAQRAESIMGATVEGTPPRKQPVTGPGIIPQAFSAVGDLLAGDPEPQPSP
jgi:hypothetical protein